MSSFNTLPHQHQHQQLRVNGSILNGQEYAVSQGPASPPFHHGRALLAPEDAPGLQPALRRASLAGSVTGLEAPTAPNGAANSPSPGSNANQQHQSQTTASCLQPKPIRRRMRMITSCLECRRRKLKCNKQERCSNCVKFGRECVYISSKLDEEGQLRLTEIKEKVGSLERQLERHVARPRRGGAHGAATSNHSGGQRSILADDVEDEFEGERDLEMTPMVALDITYEDDAEETDDVIDLGIRIGKMRITERIGGLNRPRISEEILAGIAGDKSSQEAATYGHQTQQHGQVPVLNHNGSIMDSNMNFDLDLPDFLQPGPSYIAPTSGFFFGQVLQTPSIEEFLPNTADCDRLIKRYFEAVHPIACCVHRPSFEALNATFRTDIGRNFEPRASTQAVVFAAWFSAAVSLDEGDVVREYGITKNELVTKMKVGAETALSKAGFLRTTKFETLQAFVMYLLPLCRDDVSRVHSVLVGAAVRMAECMGLHRDGEVYGLSPLETHVRRLVWHQLCFLDIRTCEAQGPKPAIRREDYDTKLPLNIDENDLAAYQGQGPGPQPVEHWTPMLLTVMRFEINEMMRTIWADRRKIEARRIPLATLLTKVENFRKRLIEKYDHMINDKVPIQHYTKLVTQLLTWRLFCMVLHPYHSNTANPMPERLRNLLIQSGIFIIDTAIQLEHQPFFRDWRWYVGAYNQYHIAILLATETFYRPENPFANHIWPCLDYVFELDPNLDRKQKTLRILQELSDKTAYYNKMRKMRAPLPIAQAIPGKQAVKEASPPPVEMPQAMMRTNQNHAQQNQPFSYQHQQQHQQQQQQQMHPQMQQQSQQMQQASQQMHQQASQQMHQQASQQMHQQASQQMQQPSQPVSYLQSMSMQQQQQLPQLQQQLPRRPMKLEPNHQQHQHLPNATTAGTNNLLSMGMMPTIPPPPQPQQQDLLMINGLPPLGTHNMVFSDSPLWGYPQNVHHNPPSPENSSEGGSPEMATHLPRLGGGQHVQAVQGLSAMEGVDWGQIEGQIGLFDMQELSLPNFNFNDLGHLTGMSAGQSSMGGQGSMAGQGDKWAGGQMP